VIVAPRAIDWPHAQLIFGHGERNRSN